MTLTIYKQDGSYYSINGVVHLLQHSHVCSDGLDMEIMVQHENGLYTMEDIHLRENEYYSMDIE